MQQRLALLRQKSNDWGSKALGGYTCYSGRLWQGCVVVKPSKWSPWFEIRQALSTQSDYMITQISNASYNPSAKCPRCWITLIKSPMAMQTLWNTCKRRSIFPNREYRRGMSVYPLWYWAKWQGTFAETLIHLLGSYAKTAQVDSLMLKNVSGSVPIPILQGSKVRELLMQQNHRKTQGSMKALLSSLQGWHGYS